MCLRLVLLAESLLSKLFLDSKEAVAPAKFLFRIVDVVLSAFWFALLFAAARLWPGILLADGASTLNFFTPPR